MGAESHLLDVVFTYQYLVEPLPEVLFQKPRSMSQFVEQFIDRRYRETIANCDVVESSIVDT